MTDKTDKGGTVSGHVREVSATERLRALLDERGVEWCDDGYPTTCTVWVSDGIVWHGLWRDDCIELIAHLTPEQAVAATLGAGTCHDTSGGIYSPGHWTCSACGFVSPSIYKLDLMGSPLYHYCPNCGRKVVG